MRKFSKSSQGVTLLEIMLVLAVAAMIIVMSVRYYQSATSSQQANAVVEQIQAITAAADGLAQSTGSYSAVTSSKLTSLLPTNGLRSPWGTTITYTAVGASSYTITIPSVPTAVCPLLSARLTANKNYTSVTACSGVTNLSYTYISNP